MSIRSSPSAGPSPTWSRTRSRSTWKGPDAMTTPRDPRAARLREEILARVRELASLEGELAAHFGVRSASLVNAGSSANLVAFSALTSHVLGDRAVRPGDEVITVAAGFPTTVAPILQHGAVPVFVDVKLPTYNVDPALLEAARTPRTRAVMLAHTLGNPFDVDAVLAFCKAHGLWLVEDNCD